MMNPQVKARWVAALRSGEYKQGQKALRKDTGEHCCLGVLCDLYAKETGAEFSELEDPWEPEFPCVDVLAWAGIECNNKSVVINGERRPLYCHNDGVGLREPSTFDQIADAIEEQL